MSIVPLYSVNSYAPRMAPVEVVDLSSMMAKKVLKMDAGKAKLAIVIGQCGIGNKGVKMVIPNKDVGMQMLKCFLQAELG